MGPHAGLFPIKRFILCPLLECVPFLACECVWCLCDGAVTFFLLTEIVGRVQEWISEDHPPIIGIETHGYSSYFGDEIIITAESPYLYDQVRGNANASVDKKTQ